MAGQAYVDTIQGDDGQWYWHLIAANGASVMIGGEGFTERNDAWESMERAQLLLSTADFSRRPWHQQ